MRDIISLLNFIHYVFTTTVKWLISQNHIERQLTACICQYAQYLRFHLADNILNTNHRSTTWQI